MQIGIHSFAAAISDPATGLMLSPVKRLHHLLEEIELADKVGLDVFGIGEHHRAEFLDSAPAVILSAACAYLKCYSVRMPLKSATFQKAETEASLVGRAECNNVTLR